MLSSICQALLLTTRCVHAATDLGCVQRQRDDETRATVVREFGTDLSTVQLDDLPADVQAESQPLLMAVTMCLVEALEDPRTLLRRHAKAVVTDRELDVPIDQTKDH